jgi:thioredoxin reductase
MDAGKIGVLFRTEIKEITEEEGVDRRAVVGREGAVANDYVFALIGGESQQFLESVGIKIVEHSGDKLKDEGIEERNPWLTAGRSNRVRSAVSRFARTVRLFVL